MRVTPFDIYQISGGKAAHLKRVELPENETIEIPSLPRVTAALRRSVTDTIGSQGIDPRRLWLVFDSGADSSDARDDKALLASPDGLIDDDIDLVLSSTGKGEAFDAVLCVPAAIEQMFLQGLHPGQTIAFSWSHLKSYTPADQSCSRTFPLALAIDALKQGACGLLKHRPGAGDAAQSGQTAIEVARYLGYAPAGIIEQGDDPPALHQILNGHETARTKIAAKADVADAFSRSGLAAGDPIKWIAWPDEDSGQQPFETHRGWWQSSKEWAEERFKNAAVHLARLKAERTQDSCVILGNGPSLRDVDLASLDGRDVFISNFALLSPALAARARYLTVVNPFVAESGALDFNVSPVPNKFAPIALAPFLSEKAGFSFLNAVGDARFLGNDPAHAISWYATVSYFNMQLAYYLGYRTVYLLGFDHIYRQGQGLPGGTVIAQDQNDDVDHYDNLYFKHRQWQAADTRMMAQAYLLAKQAFEADGRSIINCTSNTQLTVFPHGKLGDHGGAPAAKPAPAPALSHSGATISEHLKTDGYEHINVGITGLHIGERSWTFLCFKIQTYAGQFFLELRSRDAQPYFFVEVPKDISSDEYGPFFRWQIGEDGEEFAAAIQAWLEGLSAADREPMRILIREAKGITEQALSDADMDVEPWREPLERMHEAAK
ncbi:hypothetical protein BH10PSE7_BH10PSE7_25830 [soil metagenome]